MDKKHPVALVLFSLFVLAMVTILVLFFTQQAQAEKRAKQTWQIAQGELTPTPELITTMFGPGHEAGGQVQLALLGSQFPKSTLKKIKLSNVIFQLHLTIDFSARALLKVEKADGSEWEILVAMSRRQGAVRIDEIGYRPVDE